MKKIEGFWCGNKIAAGFESGECSAALRIFQDKFVRQLAQSELEERKWEMYFTKGSKDMRG